MKRKKILPFLLLALLLRLAVAPLYHHSDADTIYFWGKYLWETKDFFGFLGKGVPNAMPAVYPPFFYFLLFLWQGLRLLVFRVLWFLNITFKMFPSGLIDWFQTYEVKIAFNKGLAILADFGCAYWIYKITCLISKKQRQAIISAFFFLFFPASWYLSAYWGQIDSLWGFIILLAIYLFLKEKFLFGIFLWGVSLFVKQTGFVLLPVVALFCFRKRKLVDLLLAVGSLLVLGYILYLPFFPLNTLIQATVFYIKTFQGEINYLVANAFNFWALFFGFSPRQDNILVLGLPVFLWGYIIFGILNALIFRKLWGSPTDENLIHSSFLSSFTAFLFLPRMHERYYFTAYLFLPILMSLNKKLFTLMFLLSFVFIVNLYHLWWYPNLPVLINILSNVVVIKGIILINISIFSYLLRSFLLK